MLLTPNFDDSEFDVNETVPDQYRANLGPLAKVIQNFRDLTDQTVQGGSRARINSCYRDPARNATIPRAVSDSQHLTASAADVEFMDIGKQTLARLLLAAEANGQGPDYSQAIFYLDTNHVHIGLMFPPGDSRANYQKLVHFADGHYEVLSDSNIGLISDTPPNPSSKVTTTASSCHH